MIFTNMAYPGKDYRVQVFDAWLGETFEPMDNPKDGDKIVKRELGEDGQPVVSEELVYSGGEWVDGGGGSGESYPKFVINGTMAGAPPVITWGDSTCSMTYDELFEYLGGISGDNRAAIIEENITDPGGTTSTTIYGASMIMNNYSSGNPIYVNWSDSHVYIEVASDGTISVEE